MSKKSRRDRTLNLPPEAFNAPAYVPPAPKSSDGEVRSEAIAVNLNDEYKDVLGDLRRTFVIFIVMALAMVGLSFVIP
jgi:hypothetical protein